MKLDKSFKSVHDTIRGFDVVIRSNVKKTIASRRAIFLIHGIGVAGEYFFPLANALSRSFDVYIIDLPGYGETVKRREVLSINSLSEIVRDIIASIKADNPLLIGHSMGCQIVVKLVQSSPHLVENIILISPTVSKFERKSFIQLVRLLQDSTREPLWVNCVIIKNYLKFGIRRYLVTQKYMVEDRLEENIRSFQGSAHLVRGSRDCIASARWVSFLPTQNANTTIQTITGHAHAVHMTAAKEVASLCRSVYSNV